MKKTNDTLIIPQTISVFEDKKTKVKSLALPFQFPDGRNGVVVVTRLHKASWNPIDSIKSITLNYGD